MRRARAIVAGVFGVVCVVAVLASVLAVWANRVLFDSDSVASAVESTLDEPEVTDAVGDYVADQLISVVDLSQVVDDRVPTALTDLVEDGVRSLVAETVSDVLADDDVRATMGRVAAASHQRLLTVIEDGGLLDGVTTDAQGDVRFNLLPLLGRAIELLQDRGLLAGIDVPPLTADGDPVAQIDALEEAIGEPLPEDFGQIVVYRSERVGQARLALARAQQALVLFRKSVIAILLTTIVAFAATVALARRRARALVILAVGSVLSMGIARLLIGRIVSDAPSLVLDPGARAAIRAMVSTLASGLLTLVTAAFLVGVAIILASWLMSRFRPTPQPEGGEVR